MPVWNVLEGLAAAGLGGSGLGCQSCQEELSTGAIPSLGPQAWQESSAGGSSTFVVGDHLPCTEVQRGVSRPGTGLLGSAGAGAFAALSGQAPAKSRLRRDAVAQESRRPRRVNDAAP